MSVRTVTYRYPFTLIVYRCIPVCYPVSLPTFWFSDFLSMYISIYLPLLPLSLSLSPYRISLCPKVGEFFTKEDSPVGVRVESIGLGVDPMDDMSRFWVERYGNRFIHFIFMVYG